MRKNKVVAFVSVKDNKMDLLNKYTINQGVEIKGSYLKRGALFFVFLLLEIARFNKPEYIILRYLNDHPKIFRTFFLALNNYLTILICKVFSIKIVWILHNVDKETQQYYPKNTKMLRGLIGDLAVKIFVTDPLLVPVASELYPQWISKLDYITFGQRDDKSGVDTDRYLLKVLKSLSNHRKAGGYVLFCPTSAGDKYSHIKYASKLMNKSRELKLNYKLVLAGELNNYLIERPALKASIESDEDIIVIDGYTKYDAFEVSSYVDFYWRSLSDQSVSLTLYEAASVRKPILTLNEGFMGLAVSHYNMGGVLSIDMHDLELVHRVLAKWTRNNAEVFLTSHSWAVGAKQLCNAMQLNDR